jgi:Zn-dependent alcohol dehydrogenase
MVKAAVCRTFGAPLTVEDITVADPGDGQVAVTIEACAICHSDIHFVDGAWGGALPAVYGHEAAGVVAAVGPGVRAVEVGDRVVVSLIRSCGTCGGCRRGMPVTCSGRFPIDGGSVLHDAHGHPIVHGMGTAAFAERAVVDVSQVVVVPASVPVTSAALLGCGVITGVGAVVNTARVAGGDRVVVIGCGGVGLNAVQGAVAAGATTVVAVDVTDEKLRDAQEFGATHSLAAGDPAIVERVGEITGGGADHVFVTVGSKRAVEQAFALTGVGGTIVLVGMTASGVTVEMDATDIASRSQRVLGSKMGGGRLPVDIPRLVVWYEEGRLKLDELVTATYPLERINEAIDAVRRGEARRNVILFDGSAS